MSSSTLPKATGVALTALAVAKKHWQDLAKIFAPGILCSAFASISLFFIQTIGAESDTSLSIVAFLQMISVIALLLNTLTAFRFMNGFAQERPISIQEARAWNLGDLLRLIRTFLLTSFCLIIGAVATYGILFFSITSLIGESDITKVSLVGAVIIAGFIAIASSVLLYTMLFFTTYYHAVIDDKGALASVKESLRLTKSHRFSLLAKSIWSEITLFFSILFTPKILITLLIASSLFLVHRPLATMVMDILSTAIGAILFTSAIQHVNIQYVLALKGAKVSSLD